MKSVEQERAEYDEEMKEFVAEAVRDGEAAAPRRGPWRAPASSGRR